MSLIYCGQPAQPSTAETVEGVMQVRALANHLHHKKKAARSRTSL